jgi:hypothetical protein
MSKRIALRTHRHLDKFFLALARSRDLGSEMRRLVQASDPEYVMAVLDTMDELLGYEDIAFELADYLASVDAAGTDTPLDTLAWYRDMLANEAAEAF